ncbi:basic proline-rich protein-like [Schistocerca americana]|uniref:basic proline-rich protein-like n=1 Tax=Schistocerca americana TaxID=7009 RepID=UPI001F4F80A9|nr:basic proline-rich protein-like [Schistocerca americana]
MAAPTAPTPLATVPADKITCRLFVAPVPPQTPVPPGRVGARRTCARIASGCRHPASGPALLWEASVARNKSPVTHNLQRGQASARSVSSGLSPVEATAAAAFVSAPLHAGRWRVRPDAPPPAMPPPPGVPEMREAPAERAPPPSPPPPTVPGRGPGYGALDISTPAASAVFCLPLPMEMTSRNNVKSQSTAAAAADLPHCA